MIRESFAKHWDAGRACYERGQLEGALEHFQQALAIAPDSVPARYNLGVVYRDLEMWESAWIQFIDVIARDGVKAGAYNNLALVAEHFRLYRAAENHFRQAIALQYQFPDAHFNLGLLLLRLGRFPEGWAECEWRWQTSRFTPLQAPHPRWNGEPFRGTLLVHSEQGAGDAIQFVRFLPQAAERCNRLLFVCPQNLFSLFSSLPGVSAMRGPGTLENSEFDTYIPLMSLPHVLGTTIETIPSRVPYSQPARRSFDLGPPLVRAPRLKVGLVWAGSPTHSNDRHRSCVLANLAPLFVVPDVAFYSLQVGPQAGELRSRGKWEGVVSDLGDQLVDFADTAAALDQLDLTISVDTSVLHLAGALGRPVWGVLSFQSDWRWLLEHHDSPWYPTLRLFRQKRLDGWSDVWSRVAADLARWVPPH
jgi:Tfp pilus assembly protein PilF